MLVHCVKTNNTHTNYYSLWKGNPNIKWKLCLFYS